MNVLIISKALPQKFVKMNPVEIPQYVSKQMDAYLFYLTVRDYEQAANFINKWLPDDSIRLQVISNYGPLTRKVYSCDGVEIASFTYQQLQQDQFRPGYYIRQHELDVAILDPGYYYETIEAAGEDPWVSELFEVVEEAPNTVYIEYSHPSFFQGIYFNSPTFPYRPAIRVPAVLEYEKPGSRNTLYEDQNLNETMVRAVPYRILKFTLGDAAGVPPYMIDKTDRALSCPNVKIDGVYITKNEGAEWEENKIDFYALSGWTIELREKLNRATLQYEDDVLITGTVVAAAVIGSKGFGLDPGGNYNEIYDVN
jgi:hypothetical protein